MTRYFVRATGGSDSNDGLSYALAFATPTPFEALAVGGDELRFAPGDYRLTGTASTSGGSAYSTGTVSVTNGSAIVIGSGTSWLANAFANGQFQITKLASGTDGVTNGTSTFSSAAGKFQSSMVGLTIRISTKQAYIITAVASATSITIALPGGGAASPSAASGLTYDIGPESPYDIQSVDTNTQITLTKPWSGPTLTGVAYSTWRDIKWIGDENGQLTDGIGGRIRITGSNNDQTVTRTNCVVGSGQYRTFRGFTLDSSSGDLISTSGAGSANLIIEDCTLQNAGTNGANIQGASISAVTIRRVKCEGGAGIFFQHLATVSNAACLVENADLVGNGVGTGIRSGQVGGVLARNIKIQGYSVGARVSAALATGQSFTINNSLIYANSTGLSATAATEFIENYNGLFGNNTTRTNVTTGAQSQAYPILNAMSLLSIHTVPTTITEMMSSASQYDSIAGLYPPYDDLYSTPRAATSSWGPVQYVADQRPADAGPSHNRKFGGQ